MQRSIDPEIRASAKEVAAASQGLRGQVADATTDLHSVRVRDFLI